MNQKKGKKRGPKSEESKRKTSNSLKGRKRPEETIKKMSNSLKGRIPWNKGKTMSEESNLKRSMTMRLYWEKRKKEVI